MANFTPQEIEQFLQQFFDVVGARQYIGARYVPIFGRPGEGTIEWDDSAPYEPLTVVMHGGVSYVSRRYVPDGVGITDTDYWVETYRFNSQVEQYRQEVLRFQGQIDDRVPFPTAPYPRLGTQGQVLNTLGDGSTMWGDPVTVTEEVAGPLIDSWLDQHPEATTTIQDGAVTTLKIADDAVTDDKLYSNGIKARMREHVEGTTVLFDSILGEMPYVTPCSLTRAGNNGGYVSGENILIPPGSTGYNSFITQDLVLASLPGYQNTQITLSATLETDLGPDEFAIISNDYYGTTFDAYKELSKIGVNSYALVIAMPYDAAIRQGVVLGVQKVSDSALGGYFRLTGAHYLYDGNPNLNTTLLDSILEASVGIGTITITDYLETTSISPSTGNTAQNPDYNATQFIPVHGRRFFGLPNTGGNFAWYDRDRAFISGVPIQSTAHEYTRYAVPADAYYVRVSFWNESNGMYVTLDDGQSCPLETVNVATQNTRDSSVHFTNIRHGFEYAIGYHGTRVIVRNGTWDLTTYYAAEIAAGGTTEYGLGLGNGIDVTFMPTARVTAIYTGSDQNVTTYFAPFRMATRDGAKIGGGFALRGLDMEASNTRYCIHHEYTGADVTTDDVIEDCKFKMSNTSAPINYYPQCIGGGFAKQMLVRINGCTFDSDSQYAVDTALSYHNASVDGSRGFVEISNCYLRNTSNISIQYYGNQTVMSTVIISSCSLGAATQVTHAGGTSGPENIEVLEFGCVVR